MNENEKTCNFCSNIGCSGEESIRKCSLNGTPDGTTKMNESSVRPTVKTVETK